MAPARLAWLLRLAALCHLTLLLAGQHQGMKKCKFLCSNMTSRIPVARLLRYEQNQESCGKRAIILETKQHRFICADPEEKWVQEAMEHLNRDGTSENITKPVKLPTALAIAGGQSYLAVSEPKTKGAGSSLEVTSSSQEAQRPMGTSPELPVGMTGSSGTRSPPTPRAWEGKLSVGPEITEPINTAVASTVAWQSQPGPDPGDGKAPEVHSTQVLSTEPPSTQTPSMSHLTTEKNIGSEGQPTSVTGQGPSSPETSLGPEEMDPVLTHTYALQDWGPGSTAQASVVPASSEGTPSGEPVASSSRISKPEERIHATMNPQNLSDPPVPDPRRQAVGLLAFLGLLFCLGVAMFAYQSLQGCPRKMAGEMVEGLRYVPRSCGSNSYVLVPV